MNFHVWKYQILKPCNESSGPMMPSFFLPFKKWSYSWFAVFKTLFLKNLFLLLWWIFLQMFLFNSLLTPSHQSQFSDSVPCTHLYVTWEFSWFPRAHRSKCSLLYNEIHCNLGSCFDNGPTCFLKSLWHNALL